LSGGLRAVLNNSAVVKYFHLCQLDFINNRNSQKKKIMGAKESKLPENAEDIAAQCE
jgi:hypothetical protein